MTCSACCASAPCAHTQCDVPLFTVLVPLLSALVVQCTNSYLVYCSV